LHTNTIHYITKTVSARIQTARQTADQI